ncbi:hypothetical protein [Granulicoccus sp. GXG6511]|uniref:hypothetical protein n=1 Tax=Granulicoccus sp. GXG6511 TaxID=3381351 RepID=UPI003D7E67FC
MSQQWEQPGTRPYGGYGNSQQNPTGQNYPAYPQQTPPFGQQNYPGYGQQPYAGPPAQPYYPVVAAPVVPVVVAPAQKSPATAGVLAFFFGPLGMLYSTWQGALTLFLVNIVLIWFTAALILLVTIPIGVIWAVMAANQHNARLMVPMNQGPPTTYR